MKFTKTAVTLSALAMAVGGTMATAGPAAAVGGCPSGKLCLYEPINFGRLDVTSQSTNACIDLRNYGHTGFRHGIGSYVNNLSVNVRVYHLTANGAYALDGTIGPGRSSSNTSSPRAFGNYGKTCTGSAVPS
ncbi:peptidase inhibitor family I36 protein [Streptomyces sp. NPDC017979]|uniref:peptidase inhibitor family I36 protein n=1 Tax=Streptomyces sp. NPDC017979 TaxID=3365024 RepID=UPI0037A9BC4A